MTSLICSKCNRKINVDFNYCPNCGQNLVPNISKEIKKEISAEKDADDFIEPKSKRILDKLF